MLCYRCGSYNDESLRRCEGCGQSFATQRRATRNFPGATLVSRIHPPFDSGAVVAKRYAILAAIDPGTSGWVLRARDVEVDVDVAIKIMSANLLQTDDERRGFLKLARECRKIKHVNLAPILDLGQDDKVVYYTMPYLEGLTLAKAIELRLDKNDAFTLDETLPILTQLACAIEAWSTVAPHGALRPKNVIVTPEVLKITALPHHRGLPRRPFLALQEHYGSVGYLAPEVRRGDEASAAADVYSLAAIAAEMLSGQRLSDPRAMWAAAESRLPAGALMALHRGLGENENTRFARPTEFVSALRGVTLPVQKLISQPPPPPALEFSAKGDEALTFGGHPSLPPARSKVDTDTSTDKSRALIWIAGAFACLAAFVLATAITKPPHATVAVTVIPDATTAAGSQIASLGSGLGNAQTPERPDDLRPSPPPPATDGPAPGLKNSPTPRPKNTACPAGMRPIAAIDALVGTPNDDPLRGFGEVSARKQRLAAYCIDVYEYPNHAGMPPMRGVSFMQAKAACEREGKRLCSEAEWEHACRGRKNLRFPFGDNYAATACNAGRSDPHVLAAGEQPQCKSPYGVFDMAGNVAEWTNSDWSRDVPDKVVKGGAANQAYFTARCGARLNEPSTTKHDFIGFRCCKNAN